MNPYIEQRRRSTGRKLGTVRDRLLESERPGACVYVTGSYGREEASEHSDLDLFIVGGKDVMGKAFSRLDEICLEADLIRACRALKLPEFSGDGKYLVKYTIAELKDAIGQPEDDAQNTFTARLLLLLESKPLLGIELHAKALREVIDAYWRDYDGHEEEFTPGFLANDILRLWRTFCVNYEARTKDEPESERAKRRVKNYKLKHSRLLTCYSALAYLLAVHGREGTVSKERALVMTQLTPTRRLERLRDEFGVKPELVSNVLSYYQRFLEKTDKTDDALQAQFADTKLNAALMEEAGQFGDAVALLLQSVHADPRFRRLLTV